MTLEGTVHRTFFLLCLVVAGAASTWGLLATRPDLLWPVMLGSIISSFVVAMVTIFKQQWSPYTAPAYAVLEGLGLGVLSSVFEAIYPGIVIPAVALTFGTLFALLAAYRSGLVKATENFKLGVVAATGGVALFYLVSIVMRFGFGVDVPLIHEGGIWGIGFSLFVVGLAALNLVLDFDFIEKGVEQRAPQYMEWYAAFGLMVTLIWLYVEILRLMAKLRSRD